MLKRDLQKLSPFAKRYLVVPTQAMQEWLLFHLAGEEPDSIAMGIEWIDLTTLVRKVTEKVTEKGSVRSPYPSKPLLSLLIQSDLCSLLNGNTSITMEDQQSLEPIYTYLQDGSVLNSSRLVSLANSLSHELQLYSLYGQPQTANKQAKQSYSNTIISRLETVYGLYPLWKQLEQLSLSFPSQDLARSHPPTIYLFGFSYLAPAYQTFFKTLQNSLNIHFYTLSPSYYFLGDHETDRNRSKLLRYWTKKGISYTQRVQLDRYLQMGHPLLANWGSLGRAHFTYLEQNESLIEEHYSLHAAVASSRFASLITDELFQQSETTPFTLLKQLQTEFCLLHSENHSDPVALEESFPSIQVHEASSIEREVEIIHNLILQMITRQGHSEDPIYPSDILVMTPDLSQYTPFIETIFHRSHGLLRANIKDRSSLQESKTIQTFLKLFNLLEGSWDAPSLLEILYNPAIRRKAELSEIEVNKIESWCHLFNISWGFNAEHRVVILNQRTKEPIRMNQSDQGTWEQCWDQLIKDYVVTNDQELEQFSGHLDPLGASLVAKWMEWIYSLFDLLHIFHSDALFTAKEWSSALENLYQKLFQVSDTKSLYQKLFHVSDTKNLYSQLCFISDEERIEEQHLLDIIRSIQSIGDTVGTNQLPFASVLDYLKQCIEGFSQRVRERETDAVRFSALLPMRAIPARVIILMGMDEEQFPRAAPPKSSVAFPLASQPPNEEEYDRYLFLESLLSAKEQFVISYTKYDTQGIPKQMSSVVKELLNHLDHHYRVNEALPSISCFTSHPSQRYHESYFQSNASFPSFSQHHFNEAKSFYNATKEPIRPILSSSEPILKRDEAIPTHPITLSIHDLNSCAKHPLKFYVNKTLGIYLPKDQPQLTSHEPFDLSQLESYKLRSLLIENPPKELLAWIDKENLLPSGPFKESIKRKLETDFYSLQQGLQKLKIIPKSVRSITLSAQCTHLEGVESTHWRVPALIVHTGSQRYRIQGTLDNIFPEGLLSMGKDQFSDVAKLWPTVLLLHAIIQRDNLPLKSDLLLPQTGGAKTLNLDHPLELLGSYLDYLQCALKQPSPLMPDWLTILIKNDEQGFKAKIESSSDRQFKSYVDPYLEWLFSRNQEMELASWMGHWKSHSSTLFAPLHQWYPKVFS